ncbi:NDP-sugar epimerase [Bordetella ansorpii]|uniref:NDP-sugar epimerase n=1 Tax=Bordetella ansorpii TaxID=288768 RepID=A0A157SMC4_9BORD|nr:NAD-dependent epimerase/dehydratase family protein [Bordetella ansorpii]SAI71323.1 NDP-sugar epimerase [Bordetella ansorpii]
MSDAHALPSAAPRQVIVSGATGFIGQYVVPLLLQRGHRVVALGRDKNKAARMPWHAQVDFHCVDLRSQSFGFTPQPDAGLIHLAWSGLPDYRSLSHIEDNLPASCGLIRKLVESGVSTVLVTGTCQEYGMQDGPLDARTPTRPTTPYAIAKDTLRQYLQCLQGSTGFSLQWARLFYMYGAGQNPRSILAQLDQAIANGDAVFRMSGGEQLRDYLPVQEVARRIVDRFDSGLDGPVNICSGKPISIRRLVEERIEHVGSDIRIELGYYPYPDYEPMAFWGKNEDQQP